MTYIRAWMNLKFRKIRPWTTELAALEHIKKSMLPLFCSYLSDPFQIYVGIEHMHNIYGSSNFDYIRTHDLELSNLECLKNTS